MAHLSDVWHAYDETCNTAAHLAYTLDAPKIKQDEPDSPEAWAWRVSDEAAAPPRRPRRTACDRSRSRPPGFEGAQTAVTQTAVTERFILVNVIGTNHLCPMIFHAHAHFAMTQVKCHDLSCDNGTSTYATAKPNNTKQCILGGKYRCL